MQGDAIDSPATTRRAWIAALALALLFGAVILVTHLARDRSLVGAHGLLHTALVYSVLDRGVPPENPFAAGAAVPYYWGFHALAAAVAAGLDVNPLRAFEILNLAGLLAFVLAVTALGRHLLGSAGRGALAAGLALVAVHPLGPLVFGIRVLGGDVDFSPLLAPDQHVHPFRAALYVGDVRYCPNVVWFLNPSGRGPGLGVAAVALWLGVRAAGSPRGVRRWWVALVLAGALLAAIAPLLAVALTAAGFGLGILRPRARGTALRLTLAGVAGFALAAPTWISLLGAAGGRPPLFAPDALPAALGRVAVGAGPLILLAGLGVRRTSVRGAVDARGLLAGGAVLCLLAVVVRLPEGNEHNLFNLGAVLLALPAAAMFGRRERSPSTRLVLVIALVFLPTALLHLGACWWREPAGLSLPPERVVGAAGPSRRAVHAWLHAETAADAVIIDVAWPEDGPSRVAQNVSVLPAETRRALWVDRPSYLIPRTPEVGRRAQATYRLFGGLKLTPEDHREMRAASGPIRILCRGAAGRERVERALGRATRVVHDDGVHLVLALGAAIGGVGAARTE